MRRASYGKLVAANILIWLCVTKFATGQDDYDPENYNLGNGPDYPDYCNYYETNDEIECRHDNFPTQTLEDKYGSHVSQCCPEHGYIADEHCQVTF